VRKIRDLLAGGRRGETRPFVTCRKQSGLYLDSSSVGVRDIRGSFAIFSSAGSQETEKRRLVVLLLCRCQMRLRDRNSTRYVVLGFLETTEQIGEACF
jgi:hypothetical protein